MNTNMVWCLQWCLKKNPFSTSLVDKCIKIFLNKQLSEKILENAVPKEELFIVLPYLGMSSLCLRTRLQKSINSKISFCKIKIILKSSTRLAKFFGWKIKYISMLCIYALTLFVSFPVLDAMLPVTDKIALVLKSELVNTGVSHLQQTSSPNQKNQQLLRTIWWCATNRFLLTILKCLLLVTLSSIC